MSPLRILQLWPQFALTRSQLTPYQEHNNQRDINEMEVEPCGLVFRLPTFFFPFPLPLHKGRFGFFHGISFALQFASDTGAIYMSSVWGPRVSVFFQVRPRGQCRGCPPDPLRSSLRTFAEMDTSPQQMSSMLIHSSIHSNIYTKFGLGPGTMLDQVRYRDEVDTGLAHRA